ncbi:MAG TPA: hypothetical protein VE152_03230, partial [Acidimicrobiales bacterium]|nr:hypothetical protein [Acidimicrobiales bacterium]
MTPRWAGDSTRVRGTGRGPAGALCFLTVVPGTGRPSAAALGWFPIVGAAVGLAVGGVWAGAALVWPPAVAAALV